MVSAENKMSAMATIDTASADVRSGAMLTLREHADRHKGVTNMLTKREHGTPRLERGTSLLSLFAIAALCCSACARVDQPLSAADVGKTAAVVESPAGGG